MPGNPDTIIRAMVDLGRTPGTRGFWLVSGDVGHYVPVADVDQDMDLPEPPPFDALCIEGVYRLEGFSQLNDDLTDPINRLRSQADLSELPPGTLLRTGTPRIREEGPGTVLFEGLIWVLSAAHWREARR